MTTTPDANGRAADRRKLIAVVYADMVGYSRLIGLDDAGTLERLRGLRRTLIDPAIYEHGGRIVQTGGDFLLIVFDSIDGAVRCAMQVQRQVPIHDGDQPPDCAIRFRVGINIGDAIADGTDLHGDAVNVAVRLQAECLPGGICVSRVVHDHVHGRLDLGFEALGALNLKNIARPVHAYMLPPDAIAALPASDPAPLQAVPATTLANDDVHFLKFGRQSAIAVLPFRNYALSDEPFADGLTDELINALSRWRSFPVIARNSVFVYRGRDVDVRMIGPELGARYIVSGGIRRNDAEVRVSLDLVDVETAENLLSEHYEYASADPLALQDELVRAIAGVLAPEVLKLERERAVRRSEAEESAYDLFERGMWHRYRDTREDLESAEALFRSALEIDPHYARATAALSLCRNFAAISRWVPEYRPVPSPWLWHGEQLPTTRATRTLISRSG